MRVEDDDALAAPETLDARRPLLASRPALTHDRRYWHCRKPFHAQPCWHGRCTCGAATAFDFTETDASQVLAAACAKKDRAAT